MEWIAGNEWIIGVTIIAVVVALWLVNRLRRKRYPKTGFAPRTGPGGRHEEKR